MLVQDMLTGALHDVPDINGYADSTDIGYYGAAPGYGYYGDPETTMGGEVYDGFGNPVGFLPFLAPLASALAPLAAKVLPGIAKAIPGVSQLVGGLFPGGAPAPAQMPALPMPAPPMAPGMPAPFPMPFPQMQPPVPPGWMHAPVPYQGIAPRRHYMRCTSWPGPRGLVPVSAAQAPPGMPFPPVPIAPAVVPLQLRRHHRLRRR